MLHTWCEAVTTLNLNDVCKYIFFENLCHMVVLIADKFTSVFFIICWCVCVYFFFKVKVNANYFHFFSKDFQKNTGKNVYTSVFWKSVCTKTI